ncbi:MAG TPA: hypothetical protein VKC57_09900, partial [Ktedonobacterales bacterium]|nr:hypothetical protein [Ktedonobacterales bacterium]
METGKTKRALAVVPDTCPTIHAVDGVVDEAPRVLLWGVDTAYFSFDVEVSEETYAALLAEQHLARQAQKDRNAAYCSEWLG